MEQGASHLGAQCRVPRNEAQVLHLASPKSPKDRAELLASVLLPSWERVAGNTGPRCAAEVWLWLSPWRPSPG